MAKNLLIIILLGLSVAACRKAEIKEQADTGTKSNAAKQMNIASVNGPTSIAVGQEVSYVLSWPDANQQDVVDTLKVDSAGQELKISLFVKKSDCGNCLVKEPASTIYKFKPTKSGIYYLKFSGADSTHTITDTLTVN